MSRLLINDASRSDNLIIGTTPNDGSGDSLRVQAQKLALWATDLNSMTAELYANCIVIPSSTGNFAADFQAANNAIRDAGGGYIILQGGAVYTLNAAVTLDCGTGVGLRGNGAIIDARNMTSGTAITLTSTPATNGFPIPGYDTNTTNWLQNRIDVGGFVLIGSTTYANLVNGIDVNMPITVSTRAPRPTVRNIAINGFNKGICTRNYGYLASFSHGNVINSNYALYLNGGNNPSENTVFRDFVFSNSNYGMYIDTAAENSTAAKFDLTFETCSFDYNTVQIYLNSGYGRARFYSGNYEHNNAANPYCMDFHTTSKVCVFAFRDCYFNYTGGSPSTGFTNYFYVASGVKLTLEGSYMDSILGSGQTVGSNNYPALANVAAGGYFECRSLRSDSIPTMAPLLSLDSNANLLVDGGFEATTLQDIWYLYRDNGALVTTGSSTARTAGTNVTAIATSAAAHNTGSRCLAITRDGNGSLSANTVVVACLIPAPAITDQICGMFSCMLSAGSGSLGVTVNAAKIDPFTDQWTTNFSALAANQYVPAITKSTQLASYSVGTLTASWQTRAFTTSSNTNAPRLVLPRWATHILLLFDVSQINNPSGALYIDDLYVMGF